MLRKDVEETATNKILCTLGMHSGKQHNRTIMVYVLTLCIVLNYFRPLVLGTMVLSVAIQYLLLRWCPQLDSRRDVCHLHLRGFDS
jgi:hypothetical protein